MTPQDIITTARRIILDEKDGVIDARQSDSELLDYFNDGLKEVCTANPMMFATIGDMVCLTGEVEQSVTFDDAVRLLDVICIHDGQAIIPFDRSSMDSFHPSWRSDAPGPAQQWCPLEGGDPLTFFIWPPAPANQTIDVRYVRNATVFGLTDTVTDLPESFKPALVDYVVYRAESKDDENVINQRAVAHYQAFLAKIGAK